MSRRTQKQLDGSTADYDRQLERVESLLGLAETCNIPFVDLSRTNVDKELVSQFRHQELAKEQVLPLSLTGNRLRLAVGDPFQLENVLRHPAFQAYEIDTLLADADQIDTQLKGAFGLGKDTIAALVDQQQPTSVECNEADDVESTSRSDPSVTRFVDQLLQEAVSLTASDVHIESDEQGIKVRFRIDGFLRIQPLPSEVARFRTGIISRLKILAGMNIAQKRLPQDGHFERVFGPRTIDIRVSVMPMLHGEEVAMRIVDKTQVEPDVSSLGLPKAMQSQWEKLIRRPTGMLLVTGPTGSGKTTTLYSSLRTIQSAATKIVSVEDPVERSLSGVNQIQIQEDIGLTFGECLKRLLRHDPDVMLVGEIRDTETAKHAAQASLTGHLILSTLHANDSSSAYTRLIDMGLESYLVSSTVSGVLSQRLVRKLCPDCREAYSPHSVDLPSDFPSLTADTVYRAVGCRNCCETGYAGRIGLFELLVPTESIRRMCNRNAPPSDIRREAIAGGMITMREFGWQRVLDGETTIAEVLRVTGEVEEFVSAPESNTLAELGIEHRRHETRNFEFPQTHEGSSNLHGTSSEGRRSGF